MAKFDAKKFMKTKFQPVFKDEPVPDLQDFFPEGEPAIWRVRGLTGQEYGRASEAAEKNKNLNAVIEGLMGNSSKEKVQSVKEVFGLGKETPMDVAKRLEWLVAGSVDPTCDLEMAVKLCTVKPIEFYQLTNAIAKLTGKGQEPGKPKPSGETKASGPASPSATDTDASSTK